MNRLRTAIVTGASAGIGGRWWSSSSAIAG